MHVACVLVPGRYIKVKIKSFFFIYFKLKKLKGRVYPDDKHAIYYNEIDDLIKKIKLIDEMIGNKMNINSQIKISFDGIKIK